MRMRERENERERGREVCVLEGKCWREREVCVFGSKSVCIIDCRQKEECLREKK